MSKLKAGIETRRLGGGLGNIPDETLPGKTVAVAAAGDWRNMLQPDSRQSVVDKMMGILMRCTPFSEREELLALYDMAVRFEENIYTAATSESDYLRNLSLKLMMMEIDPAVNVLESNIASSSQNPHNSGSNNMQVAQRQVQTPDQVSGGGAVTATGIEIGNWKTQLQPDTRLRVVNKILETLKRHLPFSGSEDLLELHMIALRFEEKIYAVAVNQGLKYDVQPRACRYHGLVYKEMENSELWTN